MGRLGDSFPDDEKHKYVDRQLRPGQVLYLFCSFTDPPKEKYLVLACGGDAPLLFAINSRIRPFIQQRSDLLVCQVPLRVVDNDFLDHDSFIDCSQVIECLAETEIRTQIVADIGRVRGEIDAAARRQILIAVEGARTISRFHKQLIVDSLK